MHYATYTPQPPHSLTTPRTPLVFIHGASGDHRHFQPQLQNLGQSHMCFGLDLPGHGQSSGPAPETVGGYADSVGAGAHLPVSSTFLQELSRGDFNKDFLDWAFWLETDRKLVEWAKKELYNPDPALAYNGFKACSEYDVRTQLNRIHQQTLVVCGEKDRLTPVSLSRELADSLPQASLTLVPRSGHMVTLETPTALTAAIRQFLARAHPG